MLHRQCLVGILHAWYDTSGIRILKPILMTFQVQLEQDIEGVNLERD